MRFLPRPRGPRQDQPADRPQPPPARRRNATPAADTAEPSPPQRYYRVELVETWQVGFWVKAASPEEAADIAEHQPARRYRHCTQRTAAQLGAVEEMTGYRPGQGPESGWADPKLGAATRAGNTGHTDYPVGKNWTAIP
jgi:hypothetical protein